jgi:seryl-tRNA synthetase
MLILAQIRENPEKILERLKVKNFKNGSTIIKKLLKFDTDSRLIKVELESMSKEINDLSKEYGKLKREGKENEASLMSERTIQLKKNVKILNTKLKSKERKLEEYHLQLPNLPHSSVPIGYSANENLIVREGGQKPNLREDALPHWDLATKYNLIDFELGNKLTGAGFPVYRGKGAKLQRALINFFLDENQNSGYEEIQPPLMVNEASGFGTGQLPDKEGQMYHVSSDNFYLIPTAEVPVTNIYRDVILEESDFPIKNTAYTPCFRREAGSYGKDVRGLNRLHQFDKVEIVQIQHPLKSYETLDEMVKHVEGLLIKLKLPYRIVKLCGGDMSFTSALTYDFEVYSAGQKKWLEVSSVSNFESFQANRLKLRYRDKNTKKTVLAHTLNGSSLALPRIVASLLENYQTETEILIPDILQKYTGFDRIN